MIEESKTNKIEIEMEAALMKITYQKSEIT